MALGKNATVVLGVLVVFASATAAWWIWDGERRAAREARRAHVELARNELAQQLRFAESYQRAREVCRKARERGERVPRFCEEAGPEGEQIRADARRAEKAYREACQACASAEACARDIEALKAGEGASRRTPCD
jgi:hypothetical protein